jgi:hypothetical protein
MNFTVSVFYSISAHVPAMVSFFVPPKPADKGLYHLTLLREAEAVAR